MSEKVTGKSDYLLHVNGMRAVAILLVFFYHLESSICPAGYFGVDLFLLITGYFLLSRELSPERAQNFSFVTYWWRKWWRIMPPVIVVGLFTTLAAVILLPSNRLEPAMETMFACLLGYSNESVAHSGGYFNPFTQENPLMHLWYIGLTLQLYVVVPVLVVLSYRLCGRRFCRIVCSVAAVLSLFLYVLLSYHEDLPFWEDALSELMEYISPYYSVATRVWEPLLAALVLMLPVEGLSHRVRSVFALMGVLLVVVPVFICFSGSPFVFPVLVGGLLLLRYGDCGWTGRMLSWGPLQWFGTISYSLYLVHWPVQTLWKFCTFDDPGAWGYVGMAVMSLAVSWFVWWSVEKRCGSLLRRLPGWGALVAFIASSACLLWWSNSGWRAAVSALGPYTRTGAMKDFVESMEHPIITGRISPQELPGFPTTLLKGQMPYAQGNDSSVPFSYVLMGDSHAWHLNHGFDSVLREQGGRRGVFLNYSCVPAVDCFWESHDGNINWSRSAARSVTQWLVNSPQLKTVIISCYWKVRLKSQIVRTWNRASIPPAQRRKHIEKGLREFCTTLKAAGKRVIILMDTPYWTRPDPVDRYERSLAAGREFIWPVMSQETFDKKTVNNRKFLLSLQSEGLVECLDVAPLLRGEDGAYHLRNENGDFLYRDTDHLTRFAARPIAEFVLRYMQGEKGEN